MNNPGMRVEDSLSKGQTNCQRVVSSAWLSVGTSDGSVRGGEVVI